MKIVIISVLVILILGFIIAIPENNKNSTTKVAALDSTLSGIDTSSTLTTDDAGAYDSSKVKTLIGKFKVSEDEFNQIKWYKPKSAPENSWTNAFYCYFDGSGRHATNLRFTVQYAAHDWLFIKNCQFLIDSATYRLYPDDVKRDNGSWGIWEWFDQNVSADNDTKDVVKALYKAKTAKVKFNGSDYYDTRTISQKQLAAIKETIDLYKAMGGTL